MQLTGTSEPVAARAGDRCAETGVPAMRLQPLWKPVQRDHGLGKLCGESRGLSELRRGRERLMDRTCPCPAELVKKNHPWPVVITLKAF